jgi:hypothetical protein
LNIEGLDRSQAQRLAIAGRSFASGMRAARLQATAIAQVPTPPGPAPPDATALPGAAVPGAPGSPSSSDPAVLSPELRAQLRTMVDACAGLLSRLEAEETLQKIHFDAGSNTNYGDIGQIRFALTSEARDDRLRARLDVTVDNLTLSNVPAEAAAYVPPHIAIEPAISGVPIAKLLQVLRDATAPEVDQPALQAEAIALLADPNARVGIERLAFTSGPLRVEGSGRLRQPGNGMVAVELHLVATGVDALIAEVRSNPRVQPVLPMVFLAKGMGRPQGNSLVWDISLDDAGITVNGMPLGQPPSGRAPPSRR